MPGIPSLCRNKLDDLAGLVRTCVIPEVKLYKQLKQLLDRFIQIITVSSYCYHLNARAGVSTHKRAVSCRAPSHSFIVVMFDRKHAVQTAFLQFDGLTERKIYYVILGHGWTKRLKNFSPKLKTKIESEKY